MASTTTIRVLLLMAPGGEPAHLPLTRSPRVLVCDRVAMAAKLGPGARVVRGDPLDVGGGQPKAGGRLVLLGDQHGLARRGDSRDGGQQQHRKQRGQGC